MLTRNFSVVDSEGDQEGELEMVYFYPPSDEVEVPMNRYALNDEQLQHGSHVIIDSADGAIPHMQQSSVSMKLGGSRSTISKVENNVESSGRGTRQHRTVSAQLRASIYCFQIIRKCSHHLLFSPSSIAIRTCWRSYRCRHIFFTFTLCRNSIPEKIYE